jgi:hypothetical protein
MNVLGIDQLEKAIEGNGGDIKVTNDHAQMI